MMRALTDYHSLVFDCDGVLLDSNRVKTDAFYQAALPFGAEAATALVKYHVANGGISRYKKFEYFLTSIVRHASVDELDGLLSRYAEHVREGLLTCQVAEGLESLRVALPNSNWVIVSGGDQGELREIFAIRGISSLFNGGIYGSPADKGEILAREIDRKNIGLPALFLGDSRFDYLSAINAGLDFIFVSEWTEFEGWQEYFSGRPVPVESCRNIGSLIF